MALRTRKAFTLVELLTVVAIIAVLVGLTVPAVLMARSAARRAQCGNRQRELGLAVVQYESDKNRLPGYVNSMGTGNPTAWPLANNLSWPVVLLPYMQQNEMWAEFREGNLSETDPTPLADVFPQLLPELVCPVDDAVNKGPFPLSYVANAGMFYPSDPTLPLEFALFVNRDRSKVNGTPTQVQSERIKDRAEFTVMLSENMQATQWLTTAGTTIRPTFVADVGLLWPKTFSGAATSMPNVGIEVTLTPAAQGNYAYARPSSYHPGGVMVTFGDARQQFLDEDVDPLVYQTMICPDDVKAGVVP